MRRALPQFSKERACTCGRDNHRSGVGRHRPVCACCRTKRRFRELPRWLLSLRLDEGHLAWLAPMLGALDDWSRILRRKAG